MILVTGAAGLLGTTLVEQLLAKGYTVKAMYHHKPININHPQLIKIQADLLDVYALADAMQGVTQVYHCAALVSFNPKDAAALFSINVEGTANVVNACLDAGIQKLVHVSSVAALGRIRPGEMITEKMDWTPSTSNSKYGQSKYLGELEVWRGVAEGLQAAVVNPAIILGAGDWNDSSTKIFKSVYDEFPWYTEGVTGFVAATDVAKAMILLMESNISGEKFILSAANETYKHVFETIATAFGKKAPSKKVTPFIAALAWRFEALKSRLTGTSPLLTKETTLTALTKVYYDNSKLLSYLPSFQYTALNNTIVEACNKLLATKA